MPELKLTCQRCGAAWLPRVAEPVRCPRCGSLKWNTPRPLTGQTRERK